MMGANDAVNKLITSGTSKCLPKQEEQGREQRWAKHCKQQKPMPYLQTDKKITKKKNTNFVRQKGSKTL